MNTRAISGMAPLAFSFMLLFSCESTVYGQGSEEVSGPREGTLFSAQLIGNDVLFEIPREAIGKEFLMTARVAKAGWRVRGLYPGKNLATHLVRWERRDERLFLREIPNAVSADIGSPMESAVANTNYGAILAVLPILEVSPDGTVSIDATKLFTTHSVEFAAVREQLDPTRVFVESVFGFPENVEIEAVHTATVTAIGGPGGTPPSGQKTISFVVHWSLVQLPNPAMEPLPHDSRVGFHSISHLDYGDGTQVRALERAVTMRFRLENSPASNGENRPIRPITFVVDPATPLIWVPWIKKGIEEWQVAFSAAGFEDAIRAVDAPTSATNQPWSPDDVRYSVVRWLPSTIESADVSAVIDPRSGEILSARVSLFHNVLHQLRNWYVVQAGGVDPRASKLPLPDSLLGRLLQRLVAHEVGHVLGLSHNFQASALYPVDSLRSRSWVGRMGFTPSIMDYVRNNYVAQPEDSIPLENLIPRVGPSDVFAIRWGYGDPADLEAKWLAEQDNAPWLRFSNSIRNDSDPHQLTEAVGDADAVKATRLGLRNLTRVLEMLRIATPSEGWDDQTIRDVYSALGKQWETEVLHVIALVGGVEPPVGQVAEYVPVGRIRQQEAVSFVLEVLSAFPHFVADPTILRRVDPEGATSAIGASQLRLLSSLLGNQRLIRLLDAEMLQELGTSYTAPDFLTEVSDGIWSELSTPSQPVRPFRRLLQRTHVELLIERSSEDAQTSGGSSNDRNDCAVTGLCALIRANLLELDTRILSTIEEVSDLSSKAHLLDIHRRLAIVTSPPDTH